jgi:hypothetical protein
MYIPAMVDQPRSKWALVYCGSADARSIAWFHFQHSAAKKENGRLATTRWDIVRPRTSGMPRVRRLLCHIASIAIVVLLPLRVLAESTWIGSVPLRDIPMPPPQQRYPAKNGSISIKEAYSHPAEWEGRAVAVEGAVRSIETDAGGHPNIELVLEADETTIWAIWPLTNTHGMDSFARVGERLRVLGWVRDSIAWAKVTHLDLPRQNPMTLLPICLVKVRNSDAVLDSEYVEYCDAWQKGFMPPDMAR